MDMNQWKHLLFDWIKASELIDVFGTLEHVQLDDYFDKFYHKIHSEITYYDGKIIEIADFLKETYPDYDILYDETNNISSQDYVYIFSLFLHYSCVREKNEHFQLACTKLNPKLQICVASFLEYIDQQTIFNKEIICTGIRQAASMISPTKTTYFSVNSPMKTPRKSDISPPTPNKDFINSKLKELKLVKTQLENERFERNMLEMEVKQSQEKIDNLVKKCKDLNHEVQTLKSSVLADNDSENLSPNKAQRESQIKRKMQKEIQHREDVIIDLKYEVENVNTVNKKYQNKINVMEKQMNEMRLKMRELDASIDDLICNMTLKDEKIHDLEEERKELLEFINETRSSSAHGKDISSDCLDFSSSTSLYMTSCSEFGESLAKGVIDVQLKEKDIEISKLNDLLLSTNKAKIEMEAKISNLTETMKSLESVLSETKSSNAKLFEEKSTEIQLLQNQLNTSVLKNKEYQRDLDLKQKINLKMLKENDSHKSDVETLQIELNELKSQLIKRNEEFIRMEKDLKIAKQKQTSDEKYKEQYALFCSKLGNLATSTSCFDEKIQQFFKMINSDINAKNDKISDLINHVEEIKIKDEQARKELEEKLILKSNELLQQNTKYLLLEEQLFREKLFNDETSKNNDILIAKLQKSRNDLAKVNQELETLKEEKLKLHAEMEHKFEIYKASLHEKHNKTVSDNKIREEILENENDNLKKQLEEKEGIIKHYNLLISKFQEESLSYKDEVEKKNKTIKDLTIALEQEKREKEYITSKYRFLENNENIRSNTASTSELFEQSNNAHMDSLRCEEGFNDISSICSSSVFAQRNSLYPAHMRDSYAVVSLDKEISEHEIKSGMIKSEYQELSTSPNDSHRRRKPGTIYQRPGPPTPSKNARLSLNPNLNILKDTTNTENVENNKKATPSRFKSFSFLFSKQKDENSIKSIKRLF